MGQLAVLIDKWQTGTVTRCDLVDALVRLEYQPDQAPPATQADWGDVGGFGGEDTVVEVNSAGIAGRTPQDVVDEVHHRLWNAAHPS